MADNEPDSRAINAGVTSEGDARAAFASHHSLLTTRNPLPCETRVRFSFDPGDEGIDVGLGAGGAARRDVQQRSYAVIARYPQTAFTRELLS